MSINIHKQVAYYLTTGQVDMRVHKQVSYVVSRVRTSVTKAYVSAVVKNLTIARVSKASVYVVASSVATVATRKDRSVNFFYVAATSA